MRLHFIKYCSVLFLLFGLTGCVNFEPVGPDPDIEAYRSLLLTPEYTIGIRIYQISSFNSDAMKTDSANMPTSINPVVVVKIPRPFLYQPKDYLIPILVDEMEQKLGVTAIDITENNIVFDSPTDDPMIGERSRTSLFENITKKHPGIDAVMNVVIFVDGDYFPSTEKATGTLEMVAHLYRVDEHFLWSTHFNSNLSPTYFRAQDKLDRYDVVEKFNSIFSDSRESSQLQAQQIINALADSRN